MKGRINFELEADNIVHAPVDTPKHFIKPSTIDGCGEGAWWSRRGPQAILLGNHDNPESGTQPNSTTSAWRKTGTTNREVTVPDFPKENEHQPHAQLP